MPSMSCSHYKTPTVASQATNEFAGQLGSSYSILLKSSVSLPLSLWSFKFLSPSSILLGNIMIEYNYPECTTSAITSLAIFRKHFPDYRAQDIE